LKSKSPGPDEFFRVIPNQPPDNWSKEMKKEKKDLKEKYLWNDSLNLHDIALIHETGLALFEEGDEDAPKYEPEPEPFPDFGPDYNPEPEPFPDFGPDYNPEPEPFPDFGPDYNPEPEPVPDFGPDYNPEPEPGAQMRTRR
jgi:hypothetical protein